MYECLRATYPSSYWFPRDDSKIKWVDCSCYTNPFGRGSSWKWNWGFADKLLKVPAKRTPNILRWILTDFEFNRAEEEDFFAYYDRQTKDYFYQNLKHYSAVEHLANEDFIDFGAKEKYEKAIGMGECARVTIDLIQTLIFEAEEVLEWANKALAENDLETLLIMHIMDAFEQQRLY